MRPAVNSTHRDHSSKLSPSTLGRSVPSKARSMGRAIGGRGSNVGPLALFQNTIQNRDVTHNALLGATTKLESAPPRCVGGTVAGRGEPANRCWGLGGTPTA